jgi:hypothetical protein
LKTLENVTTVEDLLPGSPTFSKIAKFCPFQEINSWPPSDQELGVLTRELASPLRLSGFPQASLHCIKNIQIFIWSISNRKDVEDWFKIFLKKEQIKNDDLCIRSNCFSLFP